MRRILLRISAEIDGERDHTVCLYRSEGKFEVRMEVAGDLLFLQISHELKDALDSFFWVLKQRTVRMTEIHLDRSDKEN